MKAFYCAILLMASPLARAASPPDILLVKEWHAEATKAAKSDNHAPSWPWVAEGHITTLWNKLDPYVWNKIRKHGTSIGVPKVYFSKA